MIVEVAEVIAALQPELSALYGRDVAVDSNPLHPLRITCRFSRQCWYELPPHDIEDMLEKLGDMKDALLWVGDSEYKALARLKVRPLAHRIVEQVRAYEKLPEVSLGNFAIRRASLSMKRSDDLLQVQVELVVNDASAVFDGPPSTVYRNLDVHLGALQGGPPNMLAEQIRELVIGAVAHEVDEWLKLDGVLVRDAHPERGFDNWDSRAIEREIEQAAAAKATGE